jgi:CdiI immunity protein
MKKNSYEAFENLVGGYLHQDFDIYGSADGAVNAFLHDAENKFAKQLQFDLIKLISHFKNKSENELSNFVYKNTTCQYNYIMDWPSGVDWLKHLLLLVEEFFDK